MESELAVLSTLSHFLTTLSTGHTSHLPWESVTYHSGLNMSHHWCLPPPSLRHLLVRPWLAPAPVSSVGSTQPGAQCWGLRLAQERDTGIITLSFSLTFNIKTSLFNRNSTKSLTIKGCVRVCVCHVISFHNLSSKQCNDTDLII